MTIRPRFVRGIRHKLLLALSALIAAFAVFVFTFFPSRLERQAMSATRAKAATIRDMTAYSLASALVFDDTVAARQVLGGASREAEVSYIIVRDKAGRVVASIGAHPADVLPVETLAADRISADGTTISTSTAVMSNKEHVGSVEVGLSLASLRAEVASARRIGALVGVIIIGVGLLLAYAISTLVTRPLTDVADTVNRIAAGDLSLRASETNDIEIAELVHAFNRMVDTLVGTQAELASVNEGLERRVSDRTSALTSAIEELRRSRAALEESETGARRTSELLQSLIDVAPQAIVTTDHEGYVTRWNRAAERLFGWAAPEVLGRPLPYVTSNQVHELRHGGAAVDPGSGTTPAEVSRARKDGSVVSVLHASGVLRDEHDHRIGYIDFYADLTERKKLEEQLRQSQKMEALGRLAGGIAHDFNNILTIITACTELLTEDVETADARTQLAHISGAAARAASLTRQLLTFTRQQVVQVKVVDVCQTVREFEPMLRRVLPANIDFSDSISRAPAEILADRTQLEQVVMNLVVNAADAMPRGGSLTMEVCVIDLQGADIVASEGTPGRYSQLIVRDTGIGMDDATMARIFEPFFTTKDMGKGTGLGLATTYGIVTEMGGFIRVQSAVGVGSRFEVYIPEAHGSMYTTGEHGVPRAGQKEARSPRCVLLVEDEPAVRRAVRRTLERAGFQVLEADEGGAALAVVADQGERIDVVVSDLMMPGMNGVVFGETLSQTHPDLAVVYISGYTEFGAGSGPKIDERHAFLQKPFTGEQLTAAIRLVTSEPG
ncbi:MAG: ATP-binding protein [Gemmatimonadota bacterium]